MSSYTDSVAAEATLTLTGVWIHDPLDPEDTVRQYLYGRSSKAAGIAVEQAAQHYAGRTHPVVDYGDYQDDHVSVQVNVPHGEDWATQVEELRDFAQVRSTLCYRDNRGRRVFCAVTGFNEADQNWGTQVSFQVSRVDYDEAAV